MQEKLRNVIGKLQESESERPTAYFYYRPGPQEKKTRINLHYEQGLPTIKISGQHNLALADEIFANIKSLYDFTTYPNSGDRIIVAAPGPKIPNKGQQIFLNHNVIFYAKEGGPVNCNGMPINQDFTGVFLRRIKRTCSAGGQMRYYDEFKLI